MTPPFVSFEQVAKRFGHGPRILESFSLQVEKGEFISFIGPSGCGKSTLLRLIAGLLPPSDGRLLIGGVPPGQAAEELFYVFQDANLLPWRRVRRNVELPLQLRGVDPASRKAKVDRMLALVGLTEAANQFPWQLSGGMRMRASVARALTVSPRLLLLDEPFGSLDEMTRNRLDEDLLRLREEDPFTAFFVTHSVAEAVFLSSRVVVLAGPPGQLARVVEVPFVYPRRAELRESGEYLKLLASVTQILREVNEAA